jgi:hypothetical protein
MLVVSRTVEKFVPEIRNIRYATLILTPFKAADNSALINNSSVLDPRSKTKYFSTFNSKNVYYAENGNMYDPGCFILDPEFFLSRIPDAGFK